MIGCVQQNAPAGLILEVDRSIAAAYVSAFMLCLPGEICGGAANARRGVCAENLCSLSCFRSEQGQDSTPDNRYGRNFSARISVEFRVGTRIQVEQLVA